MSITFENYDEAVKALRRNLTPRQLELEMLERFVDGTQYDGMRDFFDDDVPLWERAPCIVYTIAATAIRSNVDLVVGESRFPAITSNPGEDDTEADGLAPEESKKTDRAIEELFKRVRYHAIARQALEQGQRSKSCATIIGTRKGKPFLEVEPARKCTPTFDANRDVTKLEIRYPYLQEEKQANGTWRVEAYLYRRVIDAKADTTYKPLKADKEGREPKEDAWVVDVAVDHALGFCPVVWYAHFRDCSSVVDFDGHAIHETQLDEIRGLDYALSMRHRAALFTGSPIVVEIGVEPGTNPGQTGQTSTPGAIPTTLNGGKPSAANPVEGAFTSPTRHPGRKISPGIAWQYPRPKTEVSVAYLALPDGALTALDEHSADLRNKIAEALAVVILDPENVKHAAQMSGKAIEALRSRQFDRCDQIRDDFGDGWLMPVALMLLRVALKAGVKIKSVQAVKSTLAKFTADDGSAPMLFIRWPNGYLRSGPEEEQAIVTAVAAAYAANLITLRMAVQKLSDVFQIENVDQAVAMLEKEVEQKRVQAQEDMQAAAAVQKPVPAKSKAPGSKETAAEAA